MKTESEIKRKLQELQKELDALPEYDDAISSVVGQISALEWVLRKEYSPHRYVEDTPAQKELRVSLYPIAESGKAKELIAIVNQFSPTGKLQGIPESSYEDFKKAVQHLFPESK